MGTHPIFESDFDCLTDLRSEELRESMLGEVWNQVTSNRISATPPPNLEMMRGRGSRTQIGLKRRSLCLTPKLEPLERKKRRKTLIQLPIRENFSKTENASCVSLRQISTAIMAPPRQEKSDEEDEFKDDSSFTSENESKENIPNIPTPRKRGKSLGLTPQNTPIRSPNVRTDSIIRSLTKTTPQRRRCLITQNTKRLSFDGLFRRLHSKSVSSPKSDLNLKRAFDDSVLNTATSRMHRPTEEQQKY